MTSDANERRDEHAGKSDKTADETSGSSDAGAEQRAARRKAATPRVDHTPPPVTVESGSVIIETDEAFVSHDTSGGAGHQHRHMLSSNRSIKGLKVLDDAGDTIYLDGDAAGSNIKVWWNRAVATEQVFIDGSSLAIEADVDLGMGTQIAHPPGNPSVQRIRQYVLPSTNGRGIEKVEITKGGATVFSRTTRLFMVMIWDTVG